MSTQSPLAGAGVPQTPVRTGVRAPRPLPIWILLAMLSLAGCRSRFIEASIINDTDAPVATVELDYPGASFGVSTLAPHATYTYRFKLLGSGPLTLTYAERQGAQHTAHGPELREGQQGSLVLRIGPGGAVSWRPALTPP